MTPTTRMTVLPMVIGVAAGLSALNASAVEPCGDFGECKVLIETNSTDGDVGFHFLVDGDDLRSLVMRAPNNGRWLFSYQVYGPLRDQRLTEVFAESSEPLCWFDPEEEPDEVVTLADFLERWEFGEYRFLGFTHRYHRVQGATVLSPLLPAAPLDVELDIEVDDEDMGEEPELDYTVHWAMAEPGEGHLGRCSGIDDEGEIFDNGLYNAFQAMNGDIFTIVEQPDSWEIVLEPDFNDDPEEASAEEIGLAMIYNSHVFSTRIAGNSEELAVEIPDEYIAALPPNTPVKVEVGAIAGDDNATFTEAADFCVNPDDDADSYCEEEDEEEDEDNED